MIETNNNASNKPAKESPNLSTVPSPVTLSPSSPSETNMAAESDAKERSTPSRTGTNAPVKSTSSPSPGVMPLQSQSPNTNQHLPPSCGAKQLAKLKRFLTTLQQFGSGISAEIGEKVRTLVLALVNSQISIEDFHSRLQETTNFPLKPYVIPFLKAALPLLQAELLHCAQISRQSAQQYLANNERVIFDAEFTEKNTSHLGLMTPPIKTEDTMVSSNKRRASMSSSDATTAKRPPSESSLTRSPPQALLSDRKAAESEARSAGSHSRGGLPAPAPIRLDDIMRLSRNRLENTDFRLLGGLPAAGGARAPFPPEFELPGERHHPPDSWEHVSSMLEYVSSMVDKTKSALATLQETKKRETQELMLMMKRQAEGMDHDLKKRTGEMMSLTLRQTEDKIADIKHRADDMVHEAKRQAIREIQQAVTAAELRANELVIQERNKMEKTLQQIRQTAKEDAMKHYNTQCDSLENCWNCGRRASETCSGCNKARYCGRFCQHKDWDRHHNSCGGAKENNSNSSNNSYQSSNSGSTKEKRPSSSASETDSISNPIRTSPK